MGVLVLSACFRCEGVFRVFCGSVSADEVKPVIDRIGHLALERGFCECGPVLLLLCHALGFAGIPCPALAWLFDKPSAFAVSAIRLYVFLWMAYMSVAVAVADAVRQLHCQRTIERMKSGLYGIPNIGVMFCRCWSALAWVWGTQKGRCQIFRQTKEVEAAEQDIAVLERYVVPCPPSEAGRMMYRVWACAGALPRQVCRRPAPACGCDKRLSPLHWKPVEIVSGKGRFGFISAKPSAASTVAGCRIKMRAVKPKQGGFEQMPLSVRSRRCFG